MNISAPSRVESCAECRPNWGAKTANYGTPQAPYFHVMNLLQGKSKVKKKNEMVQFWVPG